MVWVRSSSGRGRCACGFENKMIDLVPQAQREKEILLDTNWPFPGEGPAVQQDEEPKK
jgi:hypothetical protein